MTEPPLGPSKGRPTTIVWARSPATSTRITQRLRATTYSEPFGQTLDVASPPGPVPPPPVPPGPVPPEPGSGRQALPPAMASPKTLCAPPGRSRMQPRAGRARELVGPHVGSSPRESAR